MRIIGTHVVALAIAILQLALPSAGTETQPQPQHMHDDLAHDSHTEASPAASTSTPGTPPTSTQQLPSHTPPSVSSVITSTPVTKAPGAYAKPSTCPSRTINWITHSLPRQCLNTSRVPVAVGPTGVRDDTFAGPWALNIIDGRNESFYHVPQTDATSPNSTATAVVVTGSQDAAPAGNSEQATAEADPLLDNAKFLSFEDWKRQNLAQAGQSPDNPRHDRPASGPRRRPVINNALDTLGEDVEIEFDFGFGAPENSAERTWDSSVSRDVASGISPGEPQDDVGPSMSRSKDAGKTCKERFNYASFDCAATVLKTNPQCKSSSAVLVENKDSYMLNECRAENKFLIVELCEDILVDTVVLANFEFFSSMFRTFRVSVSDRYPVKSEGWKMLGTFEARNTRDIQAFLVENPLIWARYLRVEFLTHYGNEYYCPLSLLRVHGTTMMEEFKIQEELSRGDYYDQSIEDLAEGGVISGLPPVDSPPEPSLVDVQPSKPGSTKAEAQSVVPQPPPTQETLVKIDTTEDELSNANRESIRAPASDTKSDTQKDQQSVGNDGEPAPKLEIRNGTMVEGPTKTKAGSPGSSAENHETSNNSPSSENSIAAQASVASEEANTDIKTKSNSQKQQAPATNDLAAPINGQVVASQQQSQSVTRPSATNPANASPTTQESFFKSIHKRLQQLEANSTLSLQYIEEQSRILRDAFVKVEKRQLSKTETFLKGINETVMTELRGFRQQYELLWQSTVLELDSQREQHAAEVFAISSRLGVLADELVFQKRMAVVQSTLLLLCLGLVLFVRSGVANGVDGPLYQQVSSSLRETWRIGSPPISPPQRWTQRLRETMSDVNLRQTPVTDSGISTDDESDQHIDAEHSGTDDGLRSPPLGTLTPEVNIEPPSPESPDELDRGAQSGPATPRGSRDKDATWPTAPSTPVLEPEDPFNETGITHRLHTNSESGPRPVVENSTFRNMNHGPDMTNGI